MTTRLNRRRLLWALPAIIVVASGVDADAKVKTQPADLDLSLSKTTDNGHYIISVSPGISPLVIRRIHSWTGLLTTPDGRPLDHAQISINGGMPQHGHGLPTRPRVSAELGDGRYQIDGVKFNMHGWWTITLTVTGPAGPDAATFNLIL